MNNAVLRAVLIGMLLVSFGCSESGNDDQARLLKDVDSTLTYSVVFQDIDKYAGKRVAWDGIALGSYRGPKDGKKMVRENYTFLPADDRSGGVDFDKPFMFHRLEGEDFRTESAKRADANPKGHRRRLVIGTSEGSEEFKYEENGESKTIKAPVLKDVIVTVATNGDHVGGF